MVVKKDVAEQHYKPPGKVFPPPVSIRLAGRSANTPIALQHSDPIDLSGARKIWFMIGRGRIGKTTLARWAIETSMSRGGSTLLIAAADPVNRSLSDFFDNVAEPDSDEPEEVMSWLGDLLTQVIEQQMDAVVDLGGGNTSLSALIAQSPNLAEILMASGIEPIAVHVIGPDPNDLAPMAQTEMDGFRPRATLIVLNEAHAQQNRFMQVLAQPEFLSVIGRGGVPVWMPQLTPPVARQCDTYRWPYRQVPMKAGPFARSMVFNWLIRMDQSFAPVTSWLPGTPLTPEQAAS